MDPEERERRRRKYLSLGLGELASTACFTAVGVAVRPALGVAGSVAMVPLVVVLLEGGTYWLAARGWVGRGPMPRPWARLFSLFRWANWPLLAAALAVVLAHPARSRLPQAAVLAIWAFAVTEHVNYYVARLSYPLSRWFREVWLWRTPQLVRDLRSAR